MARSEPHAITTHDVRALLKNYNIDTDERPFVVYRKIAQKLGYPTNSNTVERVGRIVRRIKAQDSEAPSEANLYGALTQRILPLLKKDKNTTYKEVAQLLRCRLDTVHGVARRYGLRSPLRNEPQTGREIPNDKLSDKIRATAYYSNGARVRSFEESIKLTAHETIVLHHFLESGANNKDLGNFLGMAEETVKTHFTNIMNKTGFSTRSELAVNFLHKRFREQAVGDRQ